MATIDKTKAKGPYKVQFGYKVCSACSTNYVKTYNQTTATSFSYTCNQFTSPGNYVAVVTVTDATGASNNYTLGFDVAYPLKGEFTSDSPNKIGLEEAYNTYISVTGGQYNSVYTNLR